MPSYGAEIRLQNIDSQFNFKLPSNPEIFHISETIHGILLDGLKGTIG